MVYIWFETGVTHEIVQPDQADQLPQGPRCRDRTHARGPARTLEAKVVVQDIDSYEQMQETVALLKILALGSRQIEAGQVQPATDIIARLRERRPTR